MHAARASKAESAGSPPRGWPVAAGIFGVLLLAVVLLSATGLPAGTPAFAGPVTVGLTLFQAAAFVLAYLLAALGLGFGVLSLTTMGLRPRGVRQLPLSAAAGLAVMLWLGHGAGVLGLLSDGSAIRHIASWLPIVIGWAVLLHGIARGPIHPEKWPAPSWWMVVGVPGAAVMLVAACSPPGWLWESEIGGYDVLSYHLQLPKEWFTSAPEGVGRLWPVKHNVYSFLPSYMEGSFLHLAAMDFTIGGGRGPIEDLRGDGGWVLGCQMLHTATVIIAGACTARVVWVLAGETGAPAQVRRAAAALAGACVVNLPWSVVVGSMAYNEGALMACVAGAMLACVEPGLSPRARGGLAGLLVGAACGAKPTALVLAGPMVGLLLLARTPPRAWPWAFALGSLAGVMMIAPWLVRNWLACGNPVFPFATGVFGAAHWSVEQVERYSRAHSFSGRAFARLVMLVRGDRGLSHAQWSIVPWCAVLGLSAAVLLGRAAERTVAIVIAAGCIVGIVAWMAVTHIQSRFLLPLAPGLAVLAGFGLAVVRSRGRSVAALAAVVGGSIGVWATCNFMVQRKGTPNGLLVDGPGAMSGVAFESAFRDSPLGERTRFLAEGASPTATVNLDAERLGLGTGARLCMVGDATPLYFIAATGGAAAPVIYATTWDNQPLRRAVIARRESPGSGAAALREDGLTLLLVNFGEVDRLSRKDRWFDPEIDPESVSALLSDADSGAGAWRLIRAWPELGSALYRLEGGGR